MTEQPPPADAAPPEDDITDVAPPTRWRWLVVTALTLLLAGLGMTALYWHNRQQEVATVDLAVVYSPDQDAEDFLAGITVAAAQVNAAGGILGQPVRLRLFVEESYTDQVRLDKLVARTLRLATEIGKTRSVLAVIGHGSSATAVPASAVYDRGGKLFLATHATATSLSNHRFDLTFALQPSNADNAALLAAFARSQGWNRMVILSDNSSYGIETTDRFRSALAQQGGTILHRDRLGASHKSIDDLLLFLLDNNLFGRDEIDAFFLTSSSQRDSAHFIARARQLGLTAPILGPEYLYSREVQDMAGLAAMRDVVAVSLFDGDTVTVEGKGLADDFARLNRPAPGLWAAIGFDAVKVLAYAANRAGKSDPAAIADTMRIIRYEAPYMGATGPVVFDAHGLITDTKAYIVRHDGSRFRTVATYLKPLIGDDGQMPPPDAASERK